MGGQRLRRRTCLHEPLDEYFTTATGTASLADALQVLMTQSDASSAIATAITNLQSQFTTALGVGSFSLALTKLATTATNTAANTTSITDIKSTFTSVTGQTTFADAVSTLWTQATTGGATAGWAVTLDTGDPTYVVGIEAISDSSMKVGQFKVKADKFVVTDPTDTDPIPPFYIQGGITYIRSAKILNGDITNMNVSSTTSAHSLSGISGGEYYTGVSLAYAGNSIPVGSRLFLTFFADCRQTGSNNDYYTVFCRKFVNGSSSFTTLNGGVGTRFNFAQAKGIAQGFCWTDTGFTSLTDSYLYRLYFIRFDSSTNGGILYNAILTGMLTKK
jgi:hypothetical protein